ncbi:MAG: hypothetical protein AAGD12_17625, partial [Pseudomonadota bacterium]
ARRAELSVDRKSAGQFVSSADTEIAHRLREKIPRIYWRCADPWRGNRWWVERGCNGLEA